MLMEGGMTRILLVDTGTELFTDMTTVIMSHGTFPAIFLKLDI